MGRTYPAGRQVVRPDVTFTSEAKKPHGKLTFRLNERATVTFAFIGSNGTRRRG
jgi:hypothetical protein